MPRTAPRVALDVALTVLVIGAVYLYAVRGTALLLDLAAMTRGILCL